MPVTRHFLRDHDFLLTRIFGRLDSAMIEDHLQALARETKDMPLVLELADCMELDDVRDLTSESLQLTASLESGWQQARASKLVILVPDELIYGLARVYQAISEQHRAEVLVTRDYDEALEWLGREHLHPEIDALRLPSRNDPSGDGG